MSNSLRQVLKGECYRELVRFLAEEAEQLRNIDNVDGNDLVDYLSNEKAYRKVREILEKIIKFGGERKITADKVSKAVRYGLNIPKK